MLASRVKFARERILSNLEFLGGQIPVPEVLARKYKGVGNATVERLIIEGIVKRDPKRTAPVKKIVIEMDISEDCRVNELRLETFVRLVGIQQWALTAGDIELDNGAKAKWRTV